MIFTMKKLTKNVASQIIENVAEHLRGIIRISKIQACDWYKAFKGSREMVDDMSLFVRLSVFMSNRNIDKIKILGFKNCHMSVKRVGSRYFIHLLSLFMMLRLIFLAGNTSLHDWF